MGKAALVGMDIEGGERLLNALEGIGLDIHAALWIYLPEPEEWRLMIASPMVDQEGPRKVYLLILSKLKEVVPPPEISSISISAVGLEHHLIQALRGAARKYPDSMNKKRFTGGVINGAYIDAAYIYYVK